jgi:pimeloyl-ACP methyl ester carboxylesterase
MEVHLERWGSGEKVLFMHGAGGSSVAWGFQKSLDKVCEVVLMDLPGHGKSPGEGFREIADYAGCVALTIEENGLAGCRLAGHSMGGAIAARIALDRPGLLSGLILVGTGARLRVFPQILESILKDKETAVRAIMGYAFSKKSPPALVDAAVAVMMAAPKEIIHGDFSACDGVDMMEAVKSIELPTLIIVGEDDLLAPPKYSEYLAQQIRGSQLCVIRDAGHMVMLEKPEETNRAIEAFIARR